MRRSITFDRINIDNIKLSNEIKLIRRNLENNTHEVYEDQKIKRITSWRKSQSKFCKNLIYNILTFGILHIISLFYPRLYLKLYCNPWQAKESDYFLVEDINGNVTLCPLERKRDKSIQNDFNDKNDLIDANNINNENNNIKNAKYIFEYKSINFEYIEKDDEIIPVYMNLSKMRNEGIIHLFSEGLSTKKLVEFLTEKYGKNEYKLNIKLYLISLFKNIIPVSAIILLIEFIEFICIFNYTNLIFKTSILSILIIGQIMSIKANIINKYKDEFTLDGNKRKIKVKRNYLIKEKDETYGIIDNIDLLPGDIIYLKPKDSVPCDCLIIDGECIVSQSDLTGNLDISKKIQIKNDNNQFNYKYANINILYHGMEIIKTFSKNNQGFITVLCINTGPNTMKANQYSNILDFMTKNGNNSIKNVFNERKRIYIYMIIALIFPTIMFYMFRDDGQKTIFEKKYAKYIVIIICKSTMTSFFLAKNIITFFTVIFFYKIDITCFDPSKIINIGRINQIIFNKTETLSKNNLSIFSHHPISFNSKNKKIKFLNFTKEQSKELNLRLFDYYQNYIKNNSLNDTISDNSKTPKAKKEFNLTNIFKNKSEELITLFIECLLTCNSVENYNFELFGNNIDIQLFNEMKWDIKPLEENNHILKIKFFNKNILEISNNKNSNESYYYIINKINDIYPQNYYKLTESQNSNNFNRTKNDLSKSFSFLNNSNSNNSQLDLISSNDNSYKLRIYKKFIFNDGLSSAAIVYNFLTKELRFMIKGVPEEIINKCDRKSVPSDIEKTISFYRKKGLIILICANKLLNISNYDNNEDINLKEYMEDLTFCGFLTLEIQKKHLIKNAIEEIKKFNVNLVIVSGDNEYNCLSAGYNSGIIDDKNIFILDKDDINDKITIKKISSIFVNKEDEECQNDNSKLTAYDKISRVGTDISKTEGQIGNYKGSKIYSNKRANSKSKDLIDKNENVLENEINLLDLKKQGYNNYIQNKRIRMNKKVNELFNENSEIERIIKRKSNNDNSINKDDTNNQNKTKKTKKTLNEVSDDFSKIIQDQSDISLVNNNLTFMETFYYHNIFEQYEDIKKGIFCISGKLFNMLYKIRDRKGVKKFLEKLIKGGKIFFNMSSLDKSLLIDYLKDSSRNVVCTIGQCESDIDSIITSDVGINLKNPTNQNTILCHLFSKKNDVICLKEIIEIGRLFFENINILEYISFIYAIVINSFVLCCLIRNNGIDNGELDFLEFEFFILIVCSFLGDFDKENIYKKKNSKLLGIYFAIICFEITLIKVISLYVFTSLFIEDDELTQKEKDDTFISDYFILCSEFIITIILSFNLTTFYKENSFENKILIILCLVYLTYITNLLFLCSSNLSKDILKITNFASRESFMDSIHDNNKIYLVIAMLIDIFASGILCLVTKLFFKRIAK